MITAHVSTHRALTSCESDEWYTPPHIIAAVVDVLGGIDIDPASPSPFGPVPAITHYTANEDGLTKEWNGRVYLNPPFSQVKAWVPKLVTEYQAGRTREAILLCSAAIDTRWWQLIRGYPWCAVRGRLRFSGASNGTTRPSALVYFGKDSRRFIDVFSDIGTVYLQVTPPGGDK